MVEATPEMIEKAGLWDALMHCAGMTTMGWAGFERKEGEADNGYRHVTINFFSHYGSHDGRTGNFNQAADKLTEFAKVVRADLDALYPPDYQPLPVVDYREAFENLVAAMRDRKLASLGSDSDKQAVYHALQYLLVKYGTYGAITRRPHVIVRGAPRPELALAAKVLGMLARVEMAEITLTIHPDTCASAEEICNAVMQEIHQQTREMDKWDIRYHWICVHVNPDLSLTYKYNDPAKAESSAV